MGWEDVEGNRIQNEHPPTIRMCNRCHKKTKWVYHPERKHSRCSVCGNGWAGTSGLGHERVPYRKKV